MLSTFDSERMQYIFFYVTCFALTCRSCLSAVLLVPEYFILWLNFPSGYYINRINLDSVGALLCQYLWYNDIVLLMWCCHLFQGLADEFVDAQSEFILSLFKARILMVDLKLVDWKQNFRYPTFTHTYTHTFSHAHTHTSILTRPALPTSHTPNNRLAFSLLHLQFLKPSVCPSSVF